MEIKLKRCKHCGNIIAMVKDSGVKVICCGEPMEDLRVGTTDGALEKHVPVYEVKDNKVFVKIGSVPHPSTKEHYIEWVILTTNFGNQRKLIGPEKVNEVSFSLLEGEKVEGVFEYCNLHGLYKA